MDAMIFAAGLGTRLRPLTDEIPKALVEVHGVPMLERVARALVAAGADRLIINTHPFPEKIEEVVRANDNFGVDVHFSHEPDAPLDTAGGLAQAAPLFRGDAPFFLHNCDVVTDVDLRALYDAHTAHADALATLAVLPPSSERYLLFDEEGLCGYGPRGGGDDILVRPAVGATGRHDFTGVHVADPDLLRTAEKGRIVSIITHYLEAVRTGARVRMHEQKNVRWIDIGSHEKLAQAHEMWAAGRL